MAGYQVVTLEDVVSTADIFITATGNFNIITADHMARMKDKAIVGNIGHFDNEIDMAGLKKVKGIKRINIKPQYDEYVFPDGHSVMILAEGRLMNLGCATGHPSFVMSSSFTNQVMAQIELFGNTAKYEKKVYVLPKQLDEKVARLHLGKLGARLTELTQGAGGVHRRAGRRAVQAGSLPVLAALYRERLNCFNAEDAETQRTRGKPSKLKSGRATSRIFWDCRSGNHSLVDANAATSRPPERLSTKNIRLVARQTW